jgi:hypothetical protein
MTAIPGASNPLPRSGVQAPRREGPGRTARPATAVAHHGKLMGYTAGQLLLGYWRHVFSTPFSQLFTRTENVERASELFPVNQEGDVWYLGHVWKDDGYGRDTVPAVTREVKVPAGKGLAMPFIGGAYTWNESGEAGARADAEKLQRDLITFSAWVDGRPVPSDDMFTQHLSPYGSMGPLAKDNFASIPRWEGEPNVGAVQGSILMVDALPPGRHTVRVVARDNSGLQFDVTHVIDAVEGVEGLPAGPKSALPAPIAREIVTDDRFATHTQGLAHLWRHAADPYSRDGRAVTEVEVNHVLALALADSVSPGRVDDGERAVLESFGAEYHRSSMDAGARGRYDALFRGQGAPTSPESIADVLRQGVWTFGDQERELSGDELEKAVAMAHSDLASPGRIDEEERSAMNAVLDDLPGVGISATEPDVPEANNHASADAQYLKDTLRGAGAL